MKAELLSLVLKISETEQLLFQCSAILMEKKKSLYVRSEPPYFFLWILSHILLLYT